jgi:hypothetical protein
MRKSSKDRQARPARYREKVLSVWLRMKSPVRWYRKKIPGGLRVLINIILMFTGALCLLQIQDPLEERYGFCSLSPDLKWFPCHLEPIMIRYIRPGGAFDKAGFRDRDILLMPAVHSIAAFHKLLDKPSGSRIELEAVPIDSFMNDCQQDLSDVAEIRIVIAP